MIHAVSNEQWLRGACCSVEEGRAADGSGGGDGQQLADVAPGLRHSQSGPGAILDSGLAMKTTMARAPIPSSACPDSDSGRGL